MTHCYGCKPRPFGPVPGPILVLLALISLFPSDPIDFAEFRIDWLLLAVPIIILVLVRFFSSVDSSSRHYACACDRDWKMQGSCGA